MYFTALIVILLLIGLLVSRRKDFGGWQEFDRAATVPFRGLLALLIVALHLGQRGEIEVLADFVTPFGMQIVSMFFFISGFGLCKSYLARGNAYLDGFLRNRVGRIFTKFALLTVAVMLLCHFTGMFSLHTQVHEFATLGRAPLPFSWFIYTIIYCYIAFYACARCFKNPKAIGVALLVPTAAYIAVMMAVLRFPGFWYYTVLSFNLGYFVSLYEDRISALIRRNSTAVYILLILAVTGAYAAYETDSVHRFAAAQVLYSVQVISIYLIIRTLGFVRWQWLCWSGAISLEIYLVHGLPLLMGEKIGLSGWMLAAFTYGMCIPGAWMLKRAFEYFRLFRTFAG